MLDAVSEKAFLGQVVTLARLHGWREYHTHSSLHSAKGFPDLVLVKGERLVFAELKTQRGKVTEEQRAWLEKLSRVSVVESYVWRPGDWDAAEAVLRGIHGSRFSIADSGGAA